MVRIIILLLFILPLNAHAFGVMQGIGSGVSGGGGVVHAYTDFTEYSTTGEHESSGDWTPLGTSDASVVSTLGDKLQIPNTSGVWVFTEFELDGPDQIMCALIEDDGQYTGPYLRSNGALDRTYDGYAIRDDGAGTGFDNARLRWCDGANGANCTNLANAQSITAIAVGDWICVAVEGDTFNNDGDYDGGEYRFQLWDNGTTDPTGGDGELSDSDITALGNPVVAWCDNSSAGGCGVSATYDVDIDQTMVEIDDGNHVGFYSGSTYPSHWGAVAARALP